MTRRRSVAAAIAMAAALVCSALPAKADKLADMTAQAARDPVVFWNNQANVAIQETSTDPFLASRALALESIVVLDTVRSISGGPTFMVRLSGPRDASPVVAVAAAAHAMLCHLFPTRRAELDVAYAAALTNTAAGPARDEAVTFGEAMANAVGALRDRDGWNAMPAIAITTAPGRWRPTPPGFQPPLDPQWATLVPFVMSRPDQFRPPAPPALNSAAFRKATALTETIGEARSSERTAEQSQIARYWSDAIGTYAPAGHWNAITASVVAPLGLGIDATAELFAELNVAIADAAIAVADAKYAYWFWRPITVIRAGAAGAPAMPDWTPLLETPNHPSYISGHSGFSGAAATVLTARFGARPFRFTSDNLPGVTRGFASFHQAAEEAAFSRILGGIHYSFDNTSGLATGHAVGAWTLAVFRRIGADRGPMIVLDRTGTVVSGYALDNVAPIATVTVKPEDGKPVRIAVDPHGRFAVPSGPSGMVTLTATSITGRTATVVRRNGQVAAPLVVR